MKLRLRSFQSKGFTFIEVLVVLLIFSIVFTLITFSTSLFSSSTLMLERAHTQMIAKLYLIQEKALMTQTVYRMKAIESGYGFQYYQASTSKWIEVMKPKALRQIRLKNDMKLRLSSDNNQLIDEVMFYPQGEMTPFILILTNDKKESKEVVGLKDGHIQFEQGIVQDES